MASFLDVKEILTYKQFGSETSLYDSEIPETAQNRKKTDKYFLIVFVVLVILLMPFLIYTFYYSDIRRANGYDSCGNVCGVKNIKYDEWDCTGKDMTNKRVLVSGKCEVFKLKWTSTPIQDDDQFNNIIAPEPVVEDETGNVIEKIYDYIYEVKWKIVLASVLPLAYCLIMVFLFRHATAFLVWGILILTWSALFVCAVFVWILALNSAKNQGMIGAIGLSVTVLGLLFILIFMVKKIRLVIMLMKESTKSLFYMPSIFFVPTVSVLGLILIATACIVSTNVLCTSGILTEIYEGKLDYIPNTWMIITIVFNIIMAYWSINIIIGIQHMIIGGAISKWYFTKNKELLGRPILTSAFIAFKFHLGTIALGSLILTLVAILRGIMRGLARNPRLRLIIDCCMLYLEALLKFFTKNAYIITAMHGTSFIQSGKQAVKLISLNICNTIVVNSIADFVLAMAQVLIVCLSILTTYVIFLGQHVEPTIYVYIIVIFVALICSFAILGTFQTAIDTMFLCFCEDGLINNGVSRPYAMPLSFMEFVVSAKKEFTKQIQEKNLPTI